MIAAANHLAAVKHNDLLGVADRGETVRHQQDCKSLLGAATLFAGLVGNVSVVVNHVLAATILNLANHPAELLTVNQQSASLRMLALQ